MLEKVEANNYYRNKKNKHTYYVIGFVTHSETLEKMVLYYSTKDIIRDWVRPLELFKEKFEEL